MLPGYRHSQTKCTSNSAPSLLPSNRYAKIEGEGWEGCQGRGRERERESVCVRERERERVCERERERERDEREREREEEEVERRESGRKEGKEGGEGRKGARDFN